MKKEEAQLREEIIPLNFVGSGRCFNNMFRTINLIEACILAAPGLWFTFKVVTLVSIRARVYIGIFTAGFPFALGIVGINDEDIVTYIINFIKFWKTRRVAKFNPRAKAELNPDYIFQAQSDLPRDKLERFIAAISNGKFDKEQDLSPDIASEEYTEKGFFADEVSKAGQYGIPDLPNELKPRSQLKKEAKEKKRSEKKISNENAKKEKELKALQKKQKQIMNKRHK